MSLTLVQFKRGYGVANLSPFCMKAEILLKMSGKDYAIEDLDDPRKAPKGKLPVLRDGTQEIADSSFIQHHLESAYGVDFYPGCSDADNAIGHALSRMCEERLYWALIYARWIEPDVWPKIAAFWFGDMPPVVRSIIPVIARKQVRGNLQAHGLGRHSREEIYALASQDVAAMSHILSDKDFMLGSAPTAADAVAYAFVASLMIEELPSPLLDAAKSHPNLVAYAERCRSLWFADLQAA